MSPGRADQLVDAGLWLRLTGDHEGARRLFEEALRLEPEHARAKELVVSGASSGGSAPEPSAPRQNPFINPQPPMAESSVPSFGALMLGTVPKIEPVSRKSPPEAQSAWDSQSNPAMDLSRVAPEDNDVFDLVAVEEVPALVAPENIPEPDELQRLLSGAKDMLELDDHSGALDLLVKAEQLSPGNSDLRALRERSERTLLSMLEAKLGSLDARPQLILKEDEIIWLTLDHRAGFVLAQIDGTVSFDDLFAVSGMARLDTARILGQLLDQGVISAG